MQFLHRNQIKTSKLKFLKYSQVKDRRVRIVVTGKIKFKDGNYEHFRANSRLFLIDEATSCEISSPLSRDGLAHLLLA